MRPFKPPRPQPETITGPAGDIEALIQVPDSDVITVAAVVCHPHPQYEGTMHNKVAHTLARSFNQLGIPAVRFNFRGVGASAGAYDHGIGETADAITVIDWSAQRWPGSGRMLAGFSFGAAVALRASQTREPVCLVTVAPAIHKFDLSEFEVPACPWLIVIGSGDELVDCDDTIDWVNRLPPGPQLHVIDKAEHFFHGRLNELRDIVVAWVADLQE